MAPCDTTGMQKVLFLQIFPLEPLCVTDVAGVLMFEIALDEGVTLLVGLKCRFQGLRR